MDRPRQQPRSETDFLSESQLREMLEAREKEKEAQRRSTSRSATRWFLIIGGSLFMICLGVSFYIEWYRAKHPETTKVVPLTTQLGIKQEDVNFGKQLFNFVAPPSKAPATDPQSPPTDQK